MERQSTMSRASDPPESRATPTRLLDAAECLFSLSGFDGVPVRRITEKAGVPLGLLSYHFKSKEAVFEAVIARRAAKIAAVERPALERLVAGRYEPRDLVQNHANCYEEFSSSGDEGWTSYFRLIGQLRYVDRWLYLDEMYFLDTAKAYVSALRGLYPALPQTDAATAWMHVTCVTCSYFANAARLKALSHKAKPARANKASQFEDMVTFGANGLKAVLDAYAPQG